MITTKDIIEYLSNYDIDYIDLDKCIIKLKPSAIEKLKDIVEENSSSNND